MVERRATILIVDDERSNIQILDNALGNEYNILAAMSGQQAISVAVESLPCLILLDIMLPDISGYEVCKVLKSNKLT
jgi:putative two-component system response regulator